MDDFVSIITVNYNGIKLLGNFLNSVKKLKYPVNKYETIVVDNASTDESVFYLKNKYPWVKVIESKKNIGFGAGNNLGIVKAKGSLLLLVNNDTYLEEDCLIKAIETFKKWSIKGKVGAVSFKLVLYDKFLPVNVQDAYLHDYVVKNKTSRGICVSPYIIPNNHDRRYNEDVFIPIENNFEDNLSIKFILKKLSQPEYCLSFYKGKIYKGIFQLSDNFREVEINFQPRELKDSVVDLIQNAGNFIFRDGYGRDRGVVIIGGRQYHEIDKGQYDKEEEIPAFCGAGVLLSKEAVQKAGFFDERFFMYYEDDDLSFRLKSMGWKIVYSPNAVIRHIHAASSKEWSPIFIYNVERNRLLFIFKHWPRTIVFVEWFKYILKDTVGSPLYHLFYGEVREAAGRFKLRIRINLSLLKIIFIYLPLKNRISLRDLKHFL